MYIPGKYKISRRDIIIPRIAFAFVFVFVFVLFWPGYDQRNSLKLTYYFTSRMRSIRPGEPKANPAGRDNILLGYFGAATPAGGWYMTYI